MTRCLLWGANAVIFAALAAHPNLPTGWSIAAALIATAAWVRGFLLAGRVDG